jgi:hypothetical protein
MAHLVTSENSLHLFEMCLQQTNKQTDWLTDWLTAWSRIILEKLLVTLLVKRFPTFYGTWRFITIFTRAHHWSISWARWIQSTPSHQISLASLLMLSPFLSRSSKLCLSFRVSYQNFVCISLPTHICCTPQPYHLVSQTFVIRIEALEFVQTELLWFVTLLQFHCVTRGTVFMPFFCDRFDSKFFSLTTSIFTCSYFLIVIV